LAESWNFSPNHIQESVDPSDRLGLVKLGRVPNSRHEREFHLRCGGLHSRSRFSSQQIALFTADHQQRLARHCCEQWPEVDLGGFAAAVER